MNDSNFNLKDDVDYLKKLYDTVVFYENTNLEEILRFTNPKSKKKYDL